MVRCINSGALDFENKQVRTGSATHLMQRDHSALFSIVVKDIQDLSKNVKKEFKKLKALRRQKPRIGFLTN